MTRFVLYPANTVIYAAVAAATAAHHSCVFGWYKAGHKEERKRARAATALQLGLIERVCIDERRRRRRRPRPTAYILYEQNLLPLCRDGERGGNGGGGHGNGRGSSKNRRQAGTAPARPPEQRHRRAGEPTHAHETATPPLPPPAPPPELRPSAAPAAAIALPLCGLRNPNFSPLGAHIGRRRRRRARWRRRRRRRRHACRRCHRRQRSRSGSGRDGRMCTSARCLTAKEAAGSRAERARALCSTACVGRCGVRTKKARTANQVRTTARQSGATNLVT